MASWALRQYVNIGSSRDIHGEGPAGRDGGSADIARFIWGLSENSALPEQLEAYLRLTPQKAKTRLETDFPDFSLELGRERSRKWDALWDSSPEDLIEALLKKEAERLNHAGSGMAATYHMTLRNNHRYNPSKNTRKRFEACLVWSMGPAGQIAHKFIFKSKGFWFRLKQNDLLRCAEISTMSLLQYLLDQSIGDFDHAIGLANTVVHASNIYQRGQVSAMNQSELASQIALEVSATSTYP